MRGLGRVLIPLVVASAGLLATSPPSGAALAGSAHPAPQTLALWKMNERRGASVMHDASGHHIRGRIGDAVVTGETARRATFYRWPAPAPKEPPATHDRLVLVRDHRLNPLRGRFIVTVRFRTTQKSANIVQKGQAGASGGYWKLESVHGKVSCRFRGRAADGTMPSRAVNSGQQRLNDGRWHTVVCRRTPKQVTMTIDGSPPRRAVGPSGRIANRRPVSIGGKSNCDLRRITCDYFRGVIDYVQIDT